MDVQLRCGNATDHFTIVNMLNPSDRIVSITVHLTGIYSLLLQNRTLVQL